MGWFLPNKLKCNSFWCYWSCVWTQDFKIKRTNGENKGSNQGLSTGRCWVWRASETVPGVKVISPEVLAHNRDVGRMRCKWGMQSRAAKNAAKWPHRASLQLSALPGAALVALWPQLELCLEWGTVQVAAASSWSTAHSGAQLILAAKPLQSALPLHPASWGANARCS